MKRLTLIYSGIIFLLVAAFSNGLSTLPNSSRQIVDVSWPNCRFGSKTLYQTGLIGVTGGLDFHPNKCLASETSWFVRYGLYMNTGYPGINYGRRYQTASHYCQWSDQTCLAYNYGFAAARYGLNYAARSDVHSLSWWLDVENDNSWTDSTFLNRQVLIGAESAIHQLMPFATVGYYSYPFQWHLLTGDWRNKSPAWVATGSRHLAAAATACKEPSFNGGPVWLTQYTKVVDINLACQGLGYGSNLFASPSLKLF